MLYRQAKTLLLLMLLMIVVPSVAQQTTITGVVTDAETGESIGYASVVYKGHKIAVVSGTDGRYSITRHNGWSLTFSSVGYKSRTVSINSKVGNRLDITLKPDKKILGEVTVKSKRNRYSRRNNPAVELMRRVVAAKKKTDLELNDYYQYNKYEKITLAFNDLKPEQLKQKPFIKHPGWQIR